MLTFRCLMRFCLTFEKKKNVAFEKLDAFSISLKEYIANSLFQKPNGE